MRLLPRLEGKQKYYVIIAQLIQFPFLRTKKEEKIMNGTQKLMAAVISVFVIGFLMVGSNKEQTPEQQEGAAMIRAVTAMQEMANKKCPLAVKKQTGDQVYFATSTDTDRQTYVSLTWEQSKTQDKYSFEKAECVLNLSLGGISKLVIDGEKIIDKKVRY